MMGKCFLLFYLFLPLKCFSQSKDSLNAVILLNNNNWHLVEYCINDTCENINQDESFFGIRMNLDSNEFHKLGIYTYSFDPETFKKEISSVSCSDYFEFIKTEDTSFRKFTIKFSTNDGYFYGFLNILDETTIDFIYIVPTEKKQLVKRRYQLKNIKAD